MMTQAENKKQFETLDQYRQQGGQVIIVETQEFKTPEWPAAPKGKHMPGQPHGCYRVPGHGVR